MSIITMGSRIAAIGGGAPTVNSRQRGVPMLNAPVPSSFIYYWDDFFSNAVGLAATSPEWVGTDLVGTSAFTNGNSSVSAAGQIRVTTGTTSGDGGVLEINGTVNQGNPIYVPSASDNLSFVLAVGMSIGVNFTTSLNAFGLVANTFARGTDIITDPDTTFAAADALIIHRNTSAYSGDGAGELVLRGYTAGGTATSLVITATWPGSSNKIEIYRPAGSTDVTVYFNGTLVGTMAWNIAAGISSRPVFGAITGTNAFRQTFIDYIYAEWGAPAR